MIVAPVFAGRTYAVLGLARSGVATVEALLASGARVVAWDSREEAHAAFVGGSGITLADPLEHGLAGCAGVVVSPGVPLNKHPLASAAAAASVPVIGDIELFAQSRPFLPRHRVVGITGTNGKSTTTALIHHILATAGVPSVMAGNIGLPVLAQEPVPEGGVYVLELSSYQLDLTQSLACDVAVLLNITPDHLDRYGGEMARYAAAKQRLFAMQKPSGVAIVGVGDDWSAMIAEALSADGRDVHRIMPGGCMDQSRWPALQGPHNAQNALAAKAACEVLQVDEAAIEHGLRTYPGLPHRLERVAEIDRVLFINDSKATNPASAAPALAAFPRIHWILGGLSKTDDLDDCVAHFGHVVATYTIGQAGPKWARLLREAGQPVIESGTLEQAVRDAATAAQPGEVVLLSPACASFDQFRDFEQRGDAFRALVAEHLAAKRGRAPQAVGGRS
jgi:UDP-N-acetylmuramoylalanine--D-glutamate ligase